jgi:hypothetical protein
MCFRSKLRPDKEKRPATFMSYEEEDTCMLEGGYMYMNVLSQ